MGLNIFIQEENTGGGSGLGDLVVGRVRVFTGSSGFPLPVLPTLEQPDGSFLKGCSLGNTETGSVCPMWEGVHGLPDNEKKKERRRNNIRIQTMQHISISRCEPRCTCTFSRKCSLHCLFEKAAPYWPYIEVTFSIVEITIYT